MSKMPNSGLYLLTAADARPESLLLEQTEAALSAGIALLQYRDKRASASRMSRISKALIQLCQRYGCPLLINDNVELARQQGAAGVHLGRQDSAIKAARGQLGPESIIGASCYNSLELAKQAAEQGADYLAFGRFFTSITKPDAKPADLAVLRAAREQHNGLPIVAIGGVDAINGAGLLDAGAELLAVCAAVYGAGEQAPQAVQQAVLQFHEVFDKAQ